MSLKLSCVIPGVWELLIGLFVSKVTYLVHVECLYLVKLMVVGFCWRLMMGDDNGCGI